MKTILDFLQKHFTGTLTVSMPKLAPWMYLAFFSLFVGRQNDILWLTIVGWTSLTINVFCFFMFKIFPERKYNNLTRTLSSRKSDEEIEATVREALDHYVDAFVVKENGGFSIKTVHIDATVKHIMNLIRQ